MKNKLVILGAGGVGTVIGTALAEKYPEQTILIGRKDHVDALNYSGCDISGEINKNVKVRALEKIDFLLENSLLIVAVKITVLEKTLKGLHDKLTATTTVLLVQNGYGVKDIARRALFGILPDKNIFQAIATMGAVLKAPGHIEFYKGGLKAEKTFGENFYNDIFKKTFIDYKVTGDIDKAVWIKLIINSIANPLSVIFKAKNHVIAGEEMNELKDLLLKEGLSVAKSEGFQIQLSVNDINSFIKSNNRTSMLQDYFYKRSNEIDFINGAIIKTGEGNGINVSTNKLIYSIVKNIEKIRLEDKEETEI